MPTVDWMPITSALLSGNSEVFECRLMGPKRRLLRDSNTSGVEGKADVTGPSSKRR